MVNRKCGGIVHIAIEIDHTGDLALDIARFCGDGRKSVLVFRETQSARVVHGHNSVCHTQVSRDGHVPIDQNARTEGKFHAVHCHEALDGRHAEVFGHDQG